MKRTYEFRKGQRIRFKLDGREGVTVRRVGNYAQWLVEFDNGKTTFWWESDCEAAVKRASRRRDWRAAPNAQRCTAVVTLRDGSTADCMRRATWGPRQLCWQHALLAASTVPHPSDGLSERDHVVGDLAAQGAR